MGIGGSWLNNNNTALVVAEPQQTALALQSSVNGMSIKELGAMCAQSGFFADAGQAAQAVVKIQYGFELGIPPIAAMQGIHVIKNKLAISAGMMAALVKKSGRYDYRAKFSEDG